MLIGTYCITSIYSWETQWSSLKRCCSIRFPLIFGNNLAILTVSNLPDFHLSESDEKSNAGRDQQKLHRWMSASSPHSSAGGAKKRDGLSM